MMKRKKFLPFSKPQDEKLIRLVQDHRVLYDTKHPKHLDLDCREDIWKQISRAMEKPAHVCKSRWVNIRDMMRRRLRERLRYPQHKNNTYRYEPNLAFIIPFFKDALSTEYYIDSLEENAEMNVTAEVYLDEAEYLNDTDGDLKPSLKQLTDSLQAHDESIEIKDNSQQSLFQELNPNDPIDVFLMTVGATMQQFNPYYLNQAKSKIFQLVQEYELEQICNKDGKTDTPSGSSGS